MKILFFSEISKDALADVSNKLASLEQELKKLGGKITHCCVIPANIYLSKIKNICSKAKIKFVVVYLLSKVQS